MKELLELWRLFGLVPLRDRVRLSGLMLVSSLTEGIGLLLLVPLLSVMQHGVTSQSGPSRWLLAGFHAAGVAPGAGSLLLLFVGLLAMRNLVTFARDVLSHRVQQELVDALRLRCFRTLTGAEWRWLVGGRSSDHAALLLTDVTRVSVGFNQGLGLLVSLVTLVVIVCAALALSLTLTLVALSAGVILVVALSGQRRRAIALGSGLSGAGRDLHATVQQSLGGLRLTRILGAEERHQAFFAATLSAYRQQLAEFIRSTSRSRALYQTLGGTLLALYLYAGLAVWHVPVAELITLVIILARLLPVAANAQQQLNQWLHALPALREIDTLLAAGMAAREQLDETRAQALRPAQAIELRDVVLQWDGRAQPALDHVTLRLPVRTTTAIIGPSGAGKSTLADVLMGLLLPDAGQLCVDGRPIGTGLRRSWRSSVAYVPQDTFLFNDTIRNNLLWGGDAIDDAALGAALRRAAADFVLELPAGLDTRVGDGGVRLSGGERQRIALARALLREPALLILDEATSALDMDNERRVREAIENLHGDLTVVIIGHRLPTLEHADQVVVLEGGRVQATGTWQAVRQAGFGI